MTPDKSGRRGFLSGLVAAGGAAILSGCDQITNSKTGTAILMSVEGLNRRLAHIFVRPKALAREYAENQISAWFKPNGVFDPPDADYRAHAAQNFAQWKLVVDGLVERPLALSLAELKALPSKTQITRHDCVEGWSAIAKWQGIQLYLLLKQAGLKPGAKYVVFHCADTIDNNPDGSPIRYYESIDLEDAAHPQTILAYQMNGKPLPIPHGAPLRLRVERQLGYKQAKYVMRVQVVDSLKPFGGGKGGYWEDNGYEWYAGI